MRRKKKKKKKTNNSILRNEFWISIEIIENKTL